MKFINEDQTIIAQAEIGESVRVSGVVERAVETKTKRSHTYWVYTTIPMTMGLTSCDGPISEHTYKSISDGKLSTVDVYVGNFGCWTAEAKEQRASQTTPDHWFIGAALSLIPSIVIYMLIALIPFGKKHQSLNSRWRT